jgi:hypothetical protein
MPYNFHPEDVELTQFEKDVFSSIHLRLAVDLFIDSCTKPKDMSDAEFRDAVILHIQNQFKVAPTRVDVNTELLKAIRDDAETRKQSLDSCGVLEIPDSWKKVLQ